MRKKHLKYLLLLPLICIGGALLFREKPPEAPAVPAGTEEERLDFLRSEGWEGTLLSEQTVIVPAEDAVPAAYADLQKSLGLPFAEASGSEGLVCIYSLRHTALCAELLIADGVLVGAQCYDPETHVTLDLRGEGVSP